MAELNAIERPTSRELDTSSTHAMSQVRCVDTEGHVRYGLEDEVSTTFDGVRRYSSRWIKEAETVLTRSYKIGQKQIERLAHQTGQRIRHAANERPIQVIAAVAGIAFAAGLLLRVWRSNHHE
jgi:hypothetical protein